MERPADLSCHKDQNAMKELIDNDMDEKLTTAGMDDDEDLSDASSDDIYGAD
ncbi:hypothetical protein E4U14_007697 [Claviceps sp. LM454 group G7]|nr:hypothetical protein E4U14_007697 [Claviceps sp. LM454 group G7]